MPLKLPPGGSGTVDARSSIDGLRLLRVQRRGAPRRRKLREPLDRSIACSAKPSLTTRPCASSQSMRIWTARPGSSVTQKLRDARTVTGSPWPRGAGPRRHRRGRCRSTAPAQRAGQPTLSQLGGSDTTATAALIAAPHQARDIAPRDVAQASAFEHPSCVSPQRNQDEGGAARRLAQQARIILPGLGAEATCGLAHLRVVVRRAPAHAGRRASPAAPRTSRARAGLRRRGAHRTFRAVVVHTRERTAHDGQADGDRAAVATQHQGGRGDELRAV